MTGVFPMTAAPYSESIATNAFYEQLAFASPNWAKIFFNNKGVAAYALDPEAATLLWELSTDTLAC
jgi:Domain of unknown function (DUF5078)